jgi:hypothetical protein
MMKPEAPVESALPHIHRASLIRATKMNVAARASESLTFSLWITACNDSTGSAKQTPAQLSF